MKKVLSLAFSFLMFTCCMFFAACGGAGKDGGNENSSSDSGSGFDSNADGGSDSGTDYGALTVENTTLYENYPY